MFIGNKKKNKQTCKKYLDMFRKAPVSKYITKMSSIYMYLNSGVLKVLFYGRILLRMRGKMGVKV